MQLDVRLEDVKLPRAVTQSKGDFPRSPFNETEGLSRD